MLNLSPPPHTPTRSPQVFAELEPTALAAASIAQVHKGKLHNGMQVAVKVQHAGMQKILSDDIVNTATLMSWLNVVEPDFNFKSVR